VLKTLGWVTVGLIVGAIVRAWLVPATYVRDYAALTAQLSQLEESHAVFADKNAALARQAATLQEQVRELAHALDEVRARQSRPVAPASPESSKEDNLESTGTALDGSSSPDEAQGVPRTLSGVETIPGQVLVYQVTGSTRGRVWGTDIYTDDSSIAAAAVHAGLLQPDETGTIMVTILPGRETYNGSARHGVASSDYPNWGRSYALERLY
jgi:hypothetical protein